MLVVGVPLILYAMVNAINGKGPDLLPDNVTFQLHEIHLVNEVIPVSTLKVIDVLLNYKGRPKGGRIPPADGTGCFLKLTFLNQETRNCQFYIDSKEQADALETLLSEMKKQHPSLVLIKF